MNPDAIDVTPEEVATVVADDSAVSVIDVREDYEWDAGRIDGAEHLPVGELGARFESLDRARPVIFVCRVGGRSGMAAQAFRRAGFQAHSMAGGMLRWADEGRPMVPEGAVVADH